MKNKLYRYECTATKEQLYEKLNDKRGFYSNYGKEGEYLVGVKSDNSFFLGIERAGHTGYWYVAEVEEKDGRTVIQGKIVFDPDENGNEKPQNQSLADKIGDILICIVVFPVWLVFMLCYGLAWLVRLIIGKPIPKEKTKEQKLDDFMCNYLNCKRLSD